MSENSIQSVSFAARPPVVAILGHVDHGKTSLLDKIRNTNITAHEAGGITQSIGAWQVTVKSGDKITFIDTPGHAAFSNMRSRGANIADIVILVVASDDGVMPQTKESIKFIKESNTPFIVALTKSDVPGSQPDRVKGQLLENEVIVEGYGGDIPVISVSSKTGEGVEELLEMILLVAQVSEVKGDPNNGLEAYVVEAERDSRRGVVVSAIVKDGTLKIAQEVEAEDISAKIRGLFDQNQKPVNEVGPGDPVEILGFSEIPHVGALITTLGSEVKIRVRKDFVRKSDGFPIILKADTSGSLEAIVGQLSAQVGVMDTGIGQLTKGDVETSAATHAVLVGFNIKVPKDVKRFADEMKVKIYVYRIIYELLADVDKWIKEKEESEREKIHGKAEILAKFTHDPKLKIAGCKVIEGRISKGDRLRLVRKEEILGTLKILSLKKQKKEVDGANNGEEFGLLFTPQFDFQVGDMIESTSSNQKSLNSN